MPQAVSKVDKVQRWIILPELAWAAGFFDGEGTIACSFSHRKTSRDGGNRTLQIQIGQTDPFVLRRFQKAVGGLGVVYGPYSRPNGRAKKIWFWSVANFEHVQAVVAMLWKFLSPIKRQQAFLALQKVRG